jgi:hypothetical protein
MNHLSARGVSSNPSYSRRNSYGYANERKILGEMERIF